MKKTLIIMFSLTPFINSIELTEFEIKDEPYKGYILTDKESSRYSFIGAREDKDAIIIAAQKRNPYCLKGYNFVQCVIHTNKDKFCFYTDYIAGKQHAHIFRLDAPDPKAFALLVLYVSITAKRSDQTTKRFPKISLEPDP
jgi:hypothetical protein